MSLVLWSGGCDSTLLLYTLAMWSSEPVRALTIEHPQVEAKAEQAIARNRIAAEFNRRGLAIDHTTVRVAHEGTLGSYKGDGLGQPQIWISIGTMYLQPNDSLNVGYVAGDDVWGRFDALQSTFDGIQKVAGKSGSLSTPLRYFTKEIVIRRLMMLDLYRLCWWCEMPKLGKPCGKCHPCTRHAETLLLMRRKKRVA